MCECITSATAEQIFVLFEPYLARTYNIMKTMTRKLPDEARRAVASSEAADTVEGRCRVDRSLRWAADRPPPARRKVDPRSPAAAVRETYKLSMAIGQTQN